MGGLRGGVGDVDEGGWTAIRKDTQKRIRSNESTRANFSPARGRNKVACGHYNRTLLKETKKSMRELAENRKRGSQGRKEKNRRKRRSVWATRKVNKRTNVGEGGKGGKTRGATKAKREIGKEGR